ncbi:hypothetical protein J3459_009799 [Metarhizium acridum]|nr:hypothetical protein J3459_009799 [Metarhizium acridum]
MPAEINDIAMRASVAAVSKGSSIRVYESDVFGGIREAMFEGKWTGGSRRNVIAKGKIGSPVAATSLGLDFIRVYYIGEDNKAREICYDKHVQRGFERQVQGWRLTLAWLPFTSKHPMIKNDSHLRPARGRQYYSGMVL